eukprot:401117-Prorocentrum_minimum.AAC.1
METAGHNNWTKTSTDDLFSTLAHRVLPLALRMNGVHEDTVDLSNFPDGVARAIAVFQDFIIEPVVVHFCIQTGCQQIWRDVKEYHQAK